MLIPARLHWFLQQLHSRVQFHFRSPRRMRRMECTESPDCKRLARTTSSFLSVLVIFFSDQELSNTTSDLINAMGSINTNFLQIRQVVLEVVVLEIFLE